MKIINRLKNINKRKTPIVKIDSSLDQFDNKVIDPFKLEKANQALDYLGLPK